ncbi:nucleoside 2-deoxyribosyltransferase domain-containing protein [Streptomyces sp. AC627_RSS907]|uniref:nucleoside 2-deoxyribosyltransferase domain-containing protein n=1 Tax=Streptomyces sp. AC627_RSS907 TaxID=2823684 RepID=UPI0020B6FEF4|nr:nucleoside 2-deoxyribosyltransferase domain-containing protein [Streptomyces sp. AC627_RSS907]
MASITVVHAREPIPASGPKVFLAGPTPHARSAVESWRPAALEELAARWTGTQPLTVLTPESRGGKRAAHYDDQVGWETEARAAADAILFWIPRDVFTLPGFTTNVEFGLDVATGKAVLGCPPDCPSPERNRYLIYVAHRHGVPVRDTLADTVTAALHIVAVRQALSERPNGAALKEPQPLGTHKPPKADCPFRAIIHDGAPAKIVHEWADALAIRPRSGGCTDGHLLVIPRSHVDDFTVDPVVSATVQMRAAELAQQLGGQWNYLTSCGPDATQTVFHLHGHLVPRTAGDGLALPWTRPTHEPEPAR